MSLLASIREPKYVKLCTISYLSQLRNAINSLFYAVTEISYFMNSNAHFKNKYLLLV